jgi:hypothetical protein
VDWVVTHRIEYRRYDAAVGGVNTLYTFEVYRGDEAECRRIAQHSAPPVWHEGARVLGFATCVGPAKDWDQFLKDFAAED